LTFRHRRIFLGLGLGSADWVRWDRWQKQEVVEICVNCRGGNEE